MISHFGLWRETLLLVAAAPLVYYTLATIAAVRFFGLSQQKTPADHHCPASILKPVRGVDFGSYENFARFCKLDRPEYQSLYALNDEKDPAAPLHRQIIAAFPQKRILLFTSGVNLGPNLKVNELSLAEP